MGNCTSQVCYCCGAKEHGNHVIDQEENLQKPISEKEREDAQDIPLNYMERATSSDIFHPVQNGATMVSIDNAAGTDQLPEIFNKDDVPIRQKKSMLVQDRNLELMKIDIEGGLEYEGQMKRSTKERCGYGRLKWPDGSYFEGYWIDGQAEGRGIFKTAEGDILEGVWKKDAATGLAVFKHREGQSAYKGYLREDAQNGKGIELWSDGSYYNGEYLNGQKHGQGVYYWADGSKYSGDWDSDEMHGEGEFLWADGRKYKGFFVMGMMEGKGLYEWRDGRQYRGEYIKNKKHGYGVYTYSDGSKYEGGWRLGQQDGVGFMIDKTGKNRRKGEWNNGEFVRWIE